MAITVAEFHDEEQIARILRSDGSPLHGNFSEEQIAKIVAIAIEHLADLKIEQSKLSSIYATCLDDFQNAYADIIRESIEQPFNNALASCIKISSIQTPPTPRRERKKSCAIQ